MPHQRQHNGPPERVAPADLIVHDFREMDRRVQIAGTWKLERALLQIAVASHAHEGHGAFRGRRYVDTTEDSVARALGLDPEREKRQRQEWIDGVRDYVRLAVEGRAPRYAVDAEGMPLFGIAAFRFLEVEPEGVLKGLIIGGHRDAPEWRRRAEKDYGATIGYGKVHPVDLHRMWEAGLDAEQLARQGNEARIADFEKRGIIVADGGRAEPDVQQLYIRYRQGPGASDDMAVLAAGRLFGLSGAVGAYIADAVDTLEKYTSVVADQDEEIALKAATGRPDLVPPDDVIIWYTFISSVPDGMEAEVPDSSMRHFLQWDPALAQTILHSHFLYVQGGPWSVQPTGRHPMMDNRELYRFFEQRLEGFPAPE